ncbi:hypothetical protein [Sulfitobacter mediterraneus]|uniref:hypothetical protein n=1 Tax=Sulfitobacter mediterraneus TaxID=83219 RepID=UPI0021A75BAE|nr:hypothetical protein [Sulfitobacter mediterraneus]UWR10907.1 hypothetical protein K3753_16905 [Sulfitobacter mediterraneus]
MSIPFEIPARFLTGFHSGEFVRFGSILKDVSTGQIVGHVQETGLLQKALQTGFSLDPTGATSLIGIAQNAAISSKLNAMQTMMGTIQTLQLATLASSVVGIGVTAASAAMILSRLNEIDNTLDGIESSIATLPSKWREMALRKKLVNIRTAIDRMQEAELRPDAESIFKSGEEKLNYAFDELHDGIRSIVIEAEVDAGLLRNLLASLALCGSAQIKSLIWLDMKEAADHRARQQCSKLQELAFHMPRDLMAQRLVGGEKQAISISQDCSEIRLRAAAQPDLARALIAKNIHGREFIERVQAEESSPLLILPRS